MGRRLLDTKILEDFLAYAESKGEKGFTRSDALAEDALPENRWALIKNRALNEGLLQMTGIKKNARYYHYGYEVIDTNNDKDYIEQELDKMEIPKVNMDETVFTEIVEEEDDDLDDFLESLEFEM